MQGIRKIIFYCLVIIFFSNCKREYNNSDYSESAYKNAEKNLDKYYQTKDESYLQLALNNVEQSLQSSQTRHEAIALKIDLLSQSKNYTWGYKFVDSLNASDFKIKYKKEMWHYYFHALESQCMDDTTNRNIYLIKIISGIQNYVRQENIPDKKKDEEAYQDLVFSKISVLNNQMLFFPAKH